MVVAQVPATAANMGPGFDTFGLALKLHNRFMATEASQDNLIISPNSTVELSGLLRNPTDNLFFQAVDRVFAELGKPRPAIEVSIEGHIPLARGLGSSSTAVVAGLSVANSLSGNPFNHQQILKLAIELEGHPDNVAPALLGGVVLTDGEQTYPIPWPADWKIITVIPDYVVFTEEARQVLPRQYPLDSAVFNLRKASLLTYALLKQDSEAFSRSLDDMLHQPYRKQLIPEFDEITAIAQSHGAFGTVISGSGPTVAVFCHNHHLNSLQQALCKTGHSVKVLDADPQGLQLNPA